MVRLAILIILTPIFVRSQENSHLGDSSKGIFFQHQLTWKQIRKKAREENKYIFLDCYASWCGPCKEMEKVIYPLDSVGKFINKYFISAKVQMDSAKSDDAVTRSWYSDAHQIMNEYRIWEYPTFIFLSPNGEIVHRGIGYQEPADFISLAAKALDPQKQFYTLLRAYQTGEKDFLAMPFLAVSAREVNEPNLALHIAADYLHNYLDRLSFAEICNEQNLKFISKFATVLTSKDKVFKCFYRHSKMADSAVHRPNFSNRMVNFIVIQEEIAPMVAKAKMNNFDPEWNKMSLNITHHFGAQYVERNILNAKVEWYKSIKDWKVYCTNLVKQTNLIDIQKISPGYLQAMALNNNAWDVFQYSDNREELESALIWSERAIAMLQPKPGGSFLDTKANLLYKLGMTRDAIILQKRAVEVSPKAADLGEDLQKMEHGEPTWPTR